MISKLDRDDGLPLPTPRDWNGCCDWCGISIDPADECWLWLASDSFVPIMHVACFGDWFHRLLPDAHRAFHVDAARSIDSASAGARDHG